MAEERERRKWVGGSHKHCILRGKEKIIFTSGFEDSAEVPGRFSVRGTSEKR